MATATVDKKEKFLEQFRVSEGLEGISKSAELALENLTFPSTREEYWKYTRLTRIQNGEYAIQESNVDLNIELINPDAVHIDCINGFFRAPSGDLEDGISIEPIETIEESISNYNGEFFTALNTAYFTSGIRIRIKRGASISKAVQFNFANSDSGIQAQPRIEIISEESSTSNFTYNWINSGSENNFWNVLNEVKVAANASVRLHQLQQTEDESYLVNTTNVVQERDSRFAIHTISLGGKILRNNLNISVEGENCDTRLDGVYLTQGKQHFDNHTFVDHKVPNCLSNENYKGVLNDQSTAVFNGKVMVRQDAQKIQAYQNNQNILLSDDATINSKPELEIYADDVQCSHGSTIGQLDDEAMFYLQSRGVSEMSAKKMLIKAFVFDVLEEIELESFREYVERLVEEKYKL